MLKNSANAVHIGLVKWPTEVRKAQHVRRQAERHLARSTPCAPLAECVFGVLQQLEDEVHPVVVPVSEQHRSDPSDVGSVPLPVLLANRRVVGRHRCSLVIGHVPVADGRNFDWGAATLARRTCPSLHNLALL